MSGANEVGKGPAPTGLKLRKLDLEQVLRIDEMLDSVGDYGEVHLIVQRGELRYINKVESYKAWNGKGPTGPGE